MRLILLGPPGAGKGTHARILAEKHKLAHIAAGDTLRRHIRGNTQAGKKAKSIIEKGELVPDSLINDMMNEEIWRTQMHGARFVLDGYPRTVGQAKALEKICKKYKMNIQLVVNLTASEGMIMDRLGGRLACTQCSANFHTRNMPPKTEGKCDKCGADLKQRTDDKPETIKHRLEVYHKETEPLINFYKKQDLLKEINGDGGVKVVQEQLDGFLGQLKVPQKS